MLMIFTSVQDVNQTSYSGLKLKPATLLVLQDSLYQMVDVPQAQVLYFNFNKDEYSTSYTSGSYTLTGNSVRALTSEGGYSPQVQVQL